MPKQISMSESLSHSQLKEKISLLNQSFGVNIDAEDFKAENYSSSSVVDLLVQKITEELSGEWTSDMAFHKLRSAISEITTTLPTSITLESELNTLLPKSGRKQKMKQLEEKLGFKIDILKPNAALYGIFILLFFACIPVGIGMDWFLSGICMIVFGVIIYVLGKTGNNFRMKTVGQLADFLAWKNYLVQKQGLQQINTAEVQSKVDALIS